MEQERRPSWWRKWLKSEPFWQSVISQTVGTLFAAIILALVAVFSGIGYTPAIRYFVAYGLVILGAVTVFILGYIELIQDTRGYIISRRDKRWFWFFSISRVVMNNIVFPIIAGIGAYLFLTRQISPIIARWAGYTP